LTSSTKIDLCLDTGHCVYGGGDAIGEAEKYRSVLRFVHIKDVDDTVLIEARRRKWTFDEAIAAKVFTIVGRGSINFSGFFKTLLKTTTPAGWSSNRM
jgi:inosose dehydratase